MINTTDSHSSTLQEKPLVFWAIVLLATLGTVLAFVLSLRALGYDAAASFCVKGATIDCRAVMESKWSQLFGISLSTYGLFFYLTILFLALATRKVKLVTTRTFLSVLLVLSFLACLYSVYLFYISKYVIGAICPFCIGLYIVNLGLLVVALAAIRGSSLIAMCREGAVKLGRLPICAVTVWGQKHAGERGAAVGIGKLILVAMALTLGAPRIYVYAAHTLEASRVEKIAWPQTSQLSIALNLEGGVNGDYFKGAADAPVELVELADIECPHCRQLFFELEELEEEFAGKVLFVYKNYPLDEECNAAVEKMHENACFAAYLARCAGEQGKFWEILKEVNLLEEIDDERSKAEVREAIWSQVEAHGLDVPMIRECIESGRYGSKIKSDIRQGNQLGLTATPSVWINGKKVDNPRKEVLRTIIKSLVED